MNIASIDGRAGLRHAAAAARTRQAATATTTATQPDFKAVLTATPKSSQIVQQTPVPPAKSGTDVPTAESVFGANPWLTTATGSTPYGTQYGFNPFYFATDATAQKVAEMLGGKVVQENAILGDNGLYKQQVKNNMVELPNGRVVNAGLVASFFTHGYSSSYIESMLQNEKDMPAVG